MFPYVDSSQMVKNTYCMFPQSDLLFKMRTGASFLDKLVITPSITFSTALRTSELKQIMAYIL